MTKRKETQKDTIIFHNVLCFGFVISSRNALFDFEIYYTSTIWKLHPSGFLKAKNYEQNGWASHQGHAKFFLKMVSFVVLQFA